MEQNIYNSEELFKQNKISANNLLQNNIHPEIDFHIHSNNSDGIFSIAEIAEMAFEANINHIAITDHNTILNSYKELLQLNKKIPNSLSIHIGTEVACKFKEPYTNKNIPIEILCFNVNPFKMQEFLDRYDFAKKDSQEDDMQFLLSICQKEDLKYTPTIKVKDGFFATETLCRDLITYPENKSYFDRYYPEVFTSPKLFFKKFCANPKSSFYFDKTTNLPTINELCDFVKSLNGLCILAHPGLYIYKTDTEILTFLEEVLKTTPNINGVEAFHTNHTLTQRKLIYNFCQNHNLIFSGGSDFHTGPYSIIGFGRLHSPIELKLSDFPWITNLKY